MANELNGIPYERFQALMQAAIAPVLDIDLMPARRPTITEAIGRIVQLEPGFLQSTVTRTAIEQVLQTVYGLKPDVVVTSLLRPDPPPAVAPVPARVSRRFALDEDEAAPPPVEIEPRAPTLHMCVMCGAFWRLWPALDGFGPSWSLVSPRCGSCCDNVAMGEQIVQVYFTPTDYRIDGTTPQPTPSAKESLYGRVTISAAEIQAAKDAVPGGAFAEAARKERERALADLKRTMDSYSYGPPTLRSQELSPRENTVSIVEEGQFPSASYDVVAFDVVTFDEAAAQWPVGQAGMPTDPEQALEEFQRLTGGTIDRETAKQLLFGDRSSAAYFRAAVTPASGALTKEMLEQGIELANARGWDEKPDLFAAPPPRTEPLVSGRRGWKTSSFWNRLLNPRDDPIR